MSKFLLISQYADGVGFAQQLKEEGHEVACVIHSPEYSACGIGLVPQLDDWKFASDPKTIRIYDTTGFGDEADLFRSLGVPTYGASALSDRLEKDRMFGEEMAQKCGLQIPKAWQFTDIAKAKEFVKDYKKGKLVLKPDGKSSGTIPSTVPKDDGPDELMDALDQIENHFIGKPRFILQEFIPDAVEVCIEGWFCGRLVKNLNHTLETKKVMDSDSGPTCGAAGTVMFAADDSVTDYVANKLTEHFPSENFYCWLDLNLLLRGKDIFWLEWTPRWGFDSSPTLLKKLVHADCGEILSELAHGKMKRAPLIDGFASGIKVTLPPYPEEPHDLTPRPLRGISGFEDFFPYNVNSVDKQLMITGSSLGIALGHGETITKAVEKSMKVAKGIQLNELQFRHDLAELFEERYEKFVQAEKRHST